MNVNLIGVGAGYSYVVSGPTHQCYEDITLMRALPNVRVLSPSDHISASALFDRCMSTIGPKYLRFDAQVLPVLYEADTPDVDVGFHIHRSGDRICLVATGYMMHTALKVAEDLTVAGYSVGVIDLFDISNFAADQFQVVLSSYAGIVTLEEGFRGRGGVDAMLFELIARRNLALSMLNIGVEGGYRFELGARAELHEQVGIGPKSVMRSVTTFLQSLSD
jgi:transketolase